MPLTSGKVDQIVRDRRYPSDLTDAEWAVVEPLLPPPTAHPQGGRREKHPRRDIVDAILYVVRSGCSWRQLPVSGGGGGCRPVGNRERR